MIGRDDDWSRQRDNFGQFCDVAAEYGLIVAIEAPVGTLSPIANAFRVIEETGRTNAVVCIDPTALLRAGDTPDVLAVATRACCRTRRSTTASARAAVALRPGDGEANVDALLDALPPTFRSASSGPRPKTRTTPPTSGRELAMEGTRRFLTDYYAQRTPRTAHQPHGGALTQWRCNDLTCQSTRFPA